MKIISLGLDTTALNPASILATRLCEYGTLVEAYTVLIPNSTDQELLLNSSVKVYGVGGRNKMVQLFRLYRQVAKILSQEKYDLLTVQDPYYIGLVGSLIKFWYRLPLEIQIHGFEKETLWRRFVAKIVLRLASGVRVVSQRLATKLTVDFKVAASKIWVIPIYSPAVEKDHPIREYQSHQPFVVLTVSRLVPVKNIALQIQALAELVKSYPTVRLVVAGEGPDKEELIQLATSLSLESYVMFVGQVTDMSELYQMADIFVLTSYQEGWGLAVIEAASFGLPIIMTDVGCAGEVIQNGESGIVIPVADQGALVESLEQLVGDSELRKRLGLAAALAVKQLPTKDQTLALYRQAWERLV